MERAASAPPEEPRARWAERLPRVQMSMSLGGSPRRKSAPMSACAGISALVIAFIIVAVLQDEKIITIGTESIALIIGIVTLTIASLGVAILLVARCHDEDRHLIEVDGAFTPAVGPFVSPLGMPRASGDAETAIDKRDTPQVDHGHALSTWSWKMRLMLLLLIFFVLVGVVAIILSQNTDWASRNFPSGGGNRRPIEPDRPQPDNGGTCRSKWHVVASARGMPVRPAENSRLNNAC